jgi:purine-nucleoside phosphorylase
MEEVTFPVRALAACGVKELVLTNAAGGIDPGFCPGDFMLLADHINFMGANPLRGMGTDDRFVDLSCAYAKGLRREFAAAARRAKVRLREGVYLAVSGPSYETPAEIRAFAAMGAHAVGMSTVPEVVMARALGVEVAAISCITNAAAGLKQQELSHAEVLRTGRASARAAAALFAEFAKARASTGPASKINLKKGSRVLGSEAESR